ncbi:SpoIIE family protein phosphatase [Paenibacillus sp. sgz5001063]|uniref:SpoIIE family protein phosphatase n=1 Tax=Paenibacillus sp. sgz5001063 TaxID=3242474 RepID=UPI0036D31435
MNKRIFGFGLWREKTAKKWAFVILILLVVLNVYNLVFVDKKFGYEFIVDLLTQCVILTPLYIMFGQQKGHTKKLRESEQRYESLFLYNNAGIYVVDLSGYINSVSPNLLDLLGYTEVEIKKITFTDLFHPADIPLIQETFLDIMNGTILSSSRKLQMRHKKGRYLIFELSSVALMADGEIRGVIGFAKDITEFQKVQDKLGEIQTQLNNIYGSIDIILWSFDVPQNKLLTISPACERVLGYSAEEYYQYPDLWSAQVYDEDKDLVNGRMSSVVEGRPYNPTLEYRIVHASGEIRWVESRMFPLVDSRNGITGVNGVVLDITDKKQIEKDKQIDLDLAREVQKSVLSQPIDTPSLSINAKYVPCRNLGGDMYAWYRLNEHRYGILIMDVMGHGVSSALICMSIRSLLRGIIKAHLSPEEVINELNHHMNKLFSVSKGTTNFFFTAIYLIVDTENQTVEYINAGHPSGLLIDESGEVFHMKSSSLPIGLIPQMNPQTQTLSFNGTVRILLYTDGLIEKTGSLLKDQVGLLLQVMEASRLEPISAVMDNLLAFNKVNQQGEQEEQDDICLICMEVRGNTAVTTDIP